MSSEVREKLCHSVDKAINSTVAWLKDDSGNILTFQAKWNQSIDQQDNDSSILRLTREYKSDT